MNSYLTQGHFPLREGFTHDGAVLLSWGLWNTPEAANDETANDSEWVDEEQ